MSSSASSLTRMCATSPPPRPAAASRSAASARTGVWPRALRAGLRSVGVRGDRGAGGAQEAVEHRRVGRLEGEAAPADNHGRIRAEGPGPPGRGRAARRRHWHRPHPRRAGAGFRVKPPEQTCS
ncbi:hypothetical protein SEVIR_9G144101v4 [Setaria viridis]|uniref:Uncharacterized protein n=1 Tax=Setaria viridis TaxID=4556 RepID=A0A4U6STR2_SETVI|nr:hypothetical protein SEVIR_9G144101v2 [Setaria viridis]